MCIQLRHASSHDCCEMNRNGRRGYSLFDDREMIHNSSSIFGAKFAFRAHFAKLFERIGIARVPMVRVHSTPCEFLLARDSSSHTLRTRRAQSRIGEKEIAQLTKCGGRKLLLSFAILFGGHECASRMCGCSYAIVWVTCCGTEPDLKCKKENVLTVMDCSTRCENRNLPRRGKQSLLPFYRETNATLINGNIKR